MKRYLILLAIPALLLVWWAVGRTVDDPTVHFTAVARTTIESTVSTNGKVEPSRWAAARAETGGVVRSILVQQGDIVRAGQPLVTLDNVAAESDVATAQARLQEAEADLAAISQGGKAGAVASIQDSIASAQTAVAAAQRNYDELERLATQNAATRLQVQEAKDALDRAKLQLQAAQDQRRTLVTTSDKSVAAARVRDARAALDLAQHRLGLSSITSPMPGTLYHFDLKIGAYLQPGDLVALVGDLQTMKVTVYVDEPDLGRVGLGMAVRITWDARPGQTWWGKVDRMPTQVVALGTRTVGEVSTVVSNPNQDLIPGVSVNATIISKVAKDVPAIPKAALHTLNGTAGVYKLAGGKLAWTTISTGISDINNVQILSGLGLGDLVADRVIEPADAEIRNGMHVNVRR